ncbi:hypothetical protein SBRCBS47491_009350 [Sporothrix bragantina]|uniref:Tyrosine specific protein phosphatases domain-containing protein n=1 Tax=Sporothrix bragantina TaxID=671064 RepID=A0ABP0CTY3_9PEZI
MASTKPLAVVLGDPASIEHELVGGKGANLGRTTSAGLPIPPGFVLTTAAYRQFISSNVSVRTQIDTVLKDLNITDVTSLDEQTKAIRHAIETAPFPPELEHVTTENYKQLGLKDSGKDNYVAVRSSATAEDLADTSFAGLHDTFLDIRGLDNVLDAVKRCWASLWTARCTAYREQHSIPHAEVAIAVVVQVMVDSEMAGVMFTANPVTGNTSEIVVNSNFGLGESVVSGIVNPDEFIVVRNTGKLRRRYLGAKEMEIARNRERENTQSGSDGTVTRPIDVTRQATYSLADNQLQSLVAMSELIEKEYGGLPQDIEWAWANGRPFLLQTRPITGVRLSWDEDVDTWQTRRADEKTVWTNAWAQAYWTGAITPLYYSIRARGIRDLDDDNFRLWGRRDLIGVQRYMYRHGTMYYNLDVFGDLTRTLLPTGMRGNGAMDIFPPSMRSEAEGRSFRIIAAMKMHLRTILLSGGTHGPFAFLRSCQRWMNKYKYNYKAPPNEALNAMSDSDLRKAAAAAIANFIDFNQYPRTGFWVYSPIAFGVLRKMLANWYHGDNANCFEELLSGLPARTAQVEESIALWNLSRILANSEALRNLLETTDGVEFFNACEKTDEGRQFLAQYEIFLEEWGHRGHADRDMWYARRSEDQSIDTRSFRLLAKAHISPEDAEAKLAARRAQATEDVEKHVRQGVLGPVRLALFRAVHHYCLRFLVLRDDQRDQNDRNSMRKKRVFMEVGRRLHVRGLVDSPSDFFFLSEPELWALVEGGAGTRSRLTDAKIAGRRANFEAMQARTAEPALYLRGCQNPVDISADEEAKTTTGDAGLFRGATLSQGAVKGRVRVLRCLDEIDTLKTGDILVCNGTDPGWAPVFNVIGGLVMETGGMLAHGACLSREFGLPAVTIPGAIHKLANAAILKLDATRGEVRVLSWTGDSLATPDSSATEFERSMSHQPDQRILSLEGLVNARDFGGLTTRDGKITRSGILFRSDQLEYLTAHSAKSLFGGKHISTVVDLRTSAEASTHRCSWRDDFAGVVDIVNLPIDDGWHGNIPALASQYCNLLTGKYLAYLQHSGSNVVDAVRCLLQTSPGSASLVHCAAGKDRTGVVSAFILEVLGVDRAQVVEDYYLTAQNMDKIMARLESNPLFIERRDTAPPQIFQVHRHTMEDFLNEIDKKFGNAEKWLLSNGLKSEELTKLRELMLMDKS